MVLVKQQDATGCGLACIAMLARKRYATVRTKAMENKTELREGFGKRGNFNTGLNDLGSIAGWFELSLVRRVMFRDQTTTSIENFTNFVNDLALGCNAILAINRRQQGEKWHWVVWDSERGRVLDPMNDQVCTRGPYIRIRPWYYLRVREAG